MINATTPPDLVADSPTALLAPPTIAQSVKTDSSPKLARRPASQCLPDAGNARSWLIMALMVSAFSFCMLMQFRQSPYELSSKPIDTIRLGYNVPGVNPAEADDLTFGTTVDRESWRHVRLTGRHSSGALIEIDLLRPASWLTAHKAEAGAVIPVEFGRIGIVGPVMVESILECPEIRAGPGQSVTGIYRHHDAPTILDLETSDGERIGVTPDHRFWSVDQQAFVPAGDLVRGETLKLLDGTTRLASITPRRDSETVYTLEVQVEHVYHIAKSGVLVHNCETGYGVPPRTGQGPFGYPSGSTPKNIPVPEYAAPGIPAKPTISPGPGWTWRGKPGEPIGGDLGAWFNPKTRETMHPDLNHGPPVGPHWDWRDPDGNFWRMFLDGRIEPRP